MAHYARINAENIVTYVTPISNEIITDENGVEHEEWALDYLYSTIPYSVGDRWIQISYDNNFRFLYADIGYIWNEKLNAFISPQPYASWILDEETADWKAPVSIPETTEGGPGYIWDEELGNWKPVY
jgi:hypothetical protein